MTGNMKFWAVVITKVTGVLKNIANYQNYAKHKSCHKLDDFVGSILTALMVNRFEAE